MRCLSSEQIWQSLCTCNCRIQSLVIGIAMTGSQLAEGRAHWFHIHPLASIAIAVKVVRDWNGSRAGSKTEAISSSHIFQLLPGHLAARSCLDWIWLSRLWDGEVLLA